MIYSFDEYTIDTDTFELHRSGQRLAVQPQVLELLLLLIENRDRTLTKDEIFKTVWKGRIVSDAALSSRIKAARKLLGDDGVAQKYIRTVHGRGFRFVGSLSVDGKWAADGAPEGFRPSIAVLPFRCQSADPEIEYVAEGLAEDINTHLARMPGFLVISRNSTLAYRGATDVQQAARELGVQYLVEGALRRTETGLKVTVQLADGSSGNLLWVDHLDRSMDDVLAAQDEITRGILARIEPALSDAELNRLARRLPKDLDAWALYRRATGVLALKGWHEDTFAEAASLLRRAVELDPELAHAHAYLALVRALAHLIGLIDDPDTARNEALTAAERALSLDSRSSTVLGYAGCALADLGETARGIRLLELAIEQDPSNAQAWVARGAALVLDGRIDEGIQHLRHGMQISPLDNRRAVWGGLLARTLLRAGQVKEAVDEASAACRRDDKVFMPRLVLATALTRLDQLDEARRAFEDARRVRPSLSREDVRRAVGSNNAELMQSRGIMSFPEAQRREGKEQ